MSGSDDIEFGLTVPQWSSMAGPEAWREVARAAEANDYDWLGKGDHVVFLDDDDGWGVETITYEQFSVLSFIAGATDWIEFGTNICVTPYRHPAYLAKLALTLDNLSEGRFELGVGVGWYDREFATLGVPVGERGSRTDEFLELFDRVCNEPVVSFDGPHHQFEDVGFYPRPTRDGGPTVLVGGNAGASFRRAAEFGDGWILPASPEEVRSGRERLVRAWDDFDRDGDPIVAVESEAHLGGPDDPDRPLVGSVDSVVEGVERYVDAGATRLTVSFTDVESVDELTDQIERFAEEVIPSF